MIRRARSIGPVLGVLLLAALVPNAARADFRTLVAPGKLGRALVTRLDRALPATARDFLGVSSLSADPRYLRCTGKWAGMRLAVDRSLSRLYRSGEIGPVLKRWFEPLGAPGEMLKAVFLLNGLPE